MAIDNGWQGNNVSEEKSENLKIHPFSLKMAASVGVNDVTVFEYLYDDFMSTGVNVVAGAPGVGKTTLIVPMALAAAHLCPYDYPLRPSVRRNVIIITESVVQVQRVIYSLYNWGYTGCESKHFEERVRVISAQRLNPEFVVKVSEEYKNWTVENEKKNGEMYIALPLVVFDTANAVFDLENENDNAEVGKAMSYVKQAFINFPIIIVSHTSKISGMTESDYLSPRGASAWTGDAQGVYTVFKDGDYEDAPRVMKAIKVRFPTAFPELSFDLVTNKEKHQDVLGYDKDVWFSHSVARPLRAGERMQLKDDRKEQREQETWESVCDDLIDLVRREPRMSRTHYERLPVAKGGVKASQDRKERAINSLLDDGSLERIELEKPIGRANHYLRVNEEVVQSNQQTKFGI